MATNDNSIYAFKTAFQGGTRANRFKVSCTWPSNIGAGDGNNQAQYKIIATSIPTATINTIALSYRGRPVVYAGDRQYSPWTVTVYDDSNSSSNLWNIFQKWVEVMDGHVTHKYIGTDFSYSNHQKDITLQQLGLNGNVIRTITLHKAWPLSVYQIELSMSGSDPVSFGVQFMFDHISYGDDTIDKSLSPS
jgi:hypothetical protein